MADTTKDLSSPEPFVHPKPSPCWPGWATAGGRLCAIPPEKPNWSHAWIPLFFCSPSCDGSWTEHEVSNG